MIDAIAIVIAALSIGLAVGAVAMAWHLRRARDAGDDRTAFTDARLWDGLNTMTEGIAFWDADHRIQLWNRRYLEILPHVATFVRAGMTLKEINENAVMALAPDWSPEKRAAKVAERMASRAKPGEVYVLEMPTKRVVEIVDHRLRDGGFVSIFRDVTEARQAAARIEESETRFRDGIASMPDGFSLWDKDGRLRAWNNAYADLLAAEVRPLLAPGVSLAEIVERSLAIGNADMEPAVLQTRIAARLGRHLSASPRAEFKLPDGRSFEVVDRQTSDGGIVSVYRDITEIRTAQQNVVASEARFRDGIESMADGFMLWDSDERLVAWNRRYVELYAMSTPLLRVGLPHEELTRRNVAIMAPDASPEEREAMIALRMRRFRDHAPPWDRVLPDGTVIQITERATSGGGTVSVFKDITVERRTVERLSISEARFRDFASTASDWFWETGPSHRFSLLSYSDPELQGFGAKAIGKTRAEWASEIGVLVPDAYADLELIMERHEPFAGFIYSSQHPGSKAPMVVELFGKPLFDSAGTFHGYRGVGRDITLQQRQEAELKRALGAEREMTEHQRRFIAIASHEFRTPLSIIDGAAQRIVARCDAGESITDPEILKRLQRIRTSVSYLTTMIDRTLYSSRLDSGRLELKSEEFDLRQLVEDVCARQREVTTQFTIELAAPAAPVLI